MFSFLLGFIWLALCLWNSPTSLHKLVVLLLIDIWLLRKRQGCYEHFSTYLLVYVCAAFSWLKPRHGIASSWSGYRFSFVHIIDRKLEREDHQAAGLGHCPPTLPFFGSGSSSSNNTPNLQPLQSQGSNSFLLLLMLLGPHHPYEPIHSACCYQ